MERTEGDTTAMDVENGEGVVAGAAPNRLDCYPYTFSPLLLFAPGEYFDKGKHTPAVNTHKHFQSYPLPVRACLETLSALTYIRTHTLYTSTPIYLPPTHTHRWVETYI